MKDPECPTCREYAHLSRRHFLGLAGGFVATAAAPSWLPRVVYAQSESSSRDVIVSIFLRGGADALSLCPPFGDDSYYDLRRRIAIPRPDSTQGGRALDLDGFFGFPPAMAPLLDAYREGALAVVHACGQHSRTRSHFEAMRFMEVGQENPPAGLATGWLGRHLQLTAPSVKDAVLRAVGIGFGLPRTLLGAPLALPVPELADFGVAGDPDTRGERQDRIASMYSYAPAALKEAARNSFRTIELLEAIDFAGYQGAGPARYDGDEFGVALSSAAALIKAEVGVEAVAIDLGGWDTHGNQGPVDGYMAGLMGTLARNLGAFYEDMVASGAPGVTVVMMSEFGRNCFENGSAGCDHGHGGLMMVLGTSVRGGRVVTEWPGLAREQLYMGQDLQIAVDYRDVLSEVVAKRLGNSAWRKLFSDPSYSPVDYGIVV